MEVNVPFEVQAHQEYVLGLKLHWTRHLYGALRDEYVARTAQAEAAPKSGDEVERLMHDSTLYHYFGWLERHLQQFKYTHARGIVPTLQQQAETLHAALATPVESPLGSLRLNPALPLPDYYTQVDYHQHPGGVWSDDLDAFAYEWGATTTTPTLFDRHADLHYRFAALAGSLVGTPRRIVDLGCGFGKSTLPFADSFPDAEVFALDLSSPCVALGHRRAEEQRLRVHFSQQNAEQTDLPAGEFDLVTSTMLLHEVPPPALERILAEAQRLLRPGGWLVSLDFYNPPGGAFGEFLHFGHAQRNNEPFMRPLAERDLAATLRAAGFDEVRIEPMEEKPGAIGHDPRGFPPEWRFPWTAIAGRKRGQVDA
jgi:ubiquinone/menaquinone biosynthesis C-methylase UbiE